jgi:hypothetical protein
MTESINGDRSIISYTIKPSSSKLTEREDVLHGRTYKIKPSSHAMYITINDKDSKPYEIFIATKCPDSIAWLMTATRLISAVMRTGEDIQFIIDELKNVQDPAGSYFVKGRGHMPSVQAHIGHILETHVNYISKDQ